MRTLIIDNYDSYTYNLYQLVAKITKNEPIVVKNDEVSYDDIKKLNISNIVISPGPGNPTKLEDFGVCSEIINRADYPILGVCLGHQGIAAAYGAEITLANDVMHGRIDKIFHDNSALFKQIPQDFNVVRYHSLSVKENEKFLSHFTITARSQDGTIMGIQHKSLLLFGLQFHPESICTEYGETILCNYFKELSNQNKNSNLKFHDYNFNIYYDVISEKISSEDLFYEIYGEEKFSFWLDSSKVERGLSRFSFLGAPNGPFSKKIKFDNVINKTEEIDSKGKKTIFNENIFEYINRVIENTTIINNPDLPFNFIGGFVGYFGYELNAHCISKAIKQESRGNEPDSCFNFVDRFIAIDHQKDTCYVVALYDKNVQTETLNWVRDIKEKILRMTRVQTQKLFYEENENVEFTLDKSKTEYIESLEKVNGLLRNGESYEVCLTNELSTNTIVNINLLYSNLRKINKAPYSALLKFDELAVLSSSPERFLMINKDRWVETKPIKGTIKRGRTVLEDDFFINKLKSDEKTRAENLMIVDLLRNDLGLVCEINSVSVPKLMNVETYETVHQLVSTVKGKLKFNVSPIECIKAAFPGGSMTGSPKLRTMEIINSLEDRSRGIYSGSIGYISLDGTVDLNIIIRTIISTPNKLTLGVGGAIIYQSNFEDEYEEIMLKARALMEAIAITKTGNKNNYTIIKE